MKAILVHEPGGAERMRLETRPDPEPRPGEARETTGKVLLRCGEAS